MKKIFLIISFCLILFSFCYTEQGNEDLKIEILNTEITSRGNMQDEDYKNITNYSNYIYDSLPVNKINIKLTNTGNDKYILFLGKDFDDAENLLKDNISFNILKGNDLLKPSRLQVAIDYSDNHFFSRRLNNEMERELLKTELNEKYLKEKISIDKIRFQENMTYVVLYPGESKFFSYYKTLPIFYDYNLYASFYFYRFNLDAKYFAQINLNSNISRKQLTTNQIKEIETNGYKIFNGIVKSNKVPIKFIDIKGK